MDGRKGLIFRILLREYHRMHSSRYTENKTWKEKNRAIFIVSACDLTRSPDSFQVLCDEDLTLTNPPAVCHVIRFARNDNVPEISRLKVSAIFKQERREKNVRYKKLGSSTSRVLLFRKTCAVTKWVEWARFEGNLFSAFRHLGRDPIPNFDSSSESIGTRDTRDLSWMFHRITVGGTSGEKRVSENTFPSLTLNSRGNINGLALTASSPREVIQPVFSNRPTIHRPFVHYSLTFSENFRVLLSGIRLIGQIFSDHPRGKFCSTVSMLQLSDRKSLCGL